MISGYADHYRVLHGDQLDDLRTEAATRAGAVLEKNKKLSAETNKRRKQLEEKWKQHEEAEQRRRAEVLLARKARLRAATEKYQKSGLPQRVRTPASARQLRIRSSSLPLGQLDGASPRRASTAMDTASAIERALQAIRSEIPLSFRPAPPGGGSGDDHRQPRSSAAASATQARAQQMHNGSFSVGSGLVQSGGGSSNSYPIRNIGGAGGGGSGSQSHTAAGHANGGSTRAQPAHGGSRVHEASALSAGGAAGMAETENVATQQQQLSSGRQALVSRAIFEKELMMRHTAAAATAQYQGSRGPAAATDPAGGSLPRDASLRLGHMTSIALSAAHVQRTRQFSAFGGEYSSDSGSDRGDVVDGMRTSVDSLDEGERAVGLVPVGGSSGLHQASDSSSRGGSSDGHALVAATAGMSRGFSTWRAAEAVASERAHNPHLRTAAEPSYASAITVAASAVATAGGGDEAKLSPSKVPGIAEATAPDANSVLAGYRRTGDGSSSGDGARGGGAAAHAHEAAGTDRGAGGDFVLWQAVNQPSWDQHPGSAARRTAAAARVGATPTSTVSSQPGVYLAAGASAGHVLTAAGLPANVAEARGHRLMASGSPARVEATPMAPQRGIMLSPPTTHLAAASAAGHVLGATSSLATSTAAALSSGQFLTVQSLSLGASAAFGNDPAAFQSQRSPATAAAVAAEDAVGYGGRSQLRARAGLPGPARPQATAYGVPEQSFGSTLTDAARAVDGRQRGEALVQPSGRGGGGGVSGGAAGTFDSGSVLSDSAASLSSRGAVRGILKSAVARGGTEDDSGVLSVRSERRLAGSKQRSLSTPNIRDSLDVTKERTDSSSKPPTPRKKSVRFADSDSEVDGTASEESAKNGADRVPELQSAIAPFPAGTGTWGTRATSASTAAAAQKPPAPPSARSQRATSAMLAAAARRRGLPVATRLPIHRRLRPADSASAVDGNEIAGSPAGDPSKDDGAGKAGAIADEATGVHLGRTPTDEEINSLWRTVRSCLTKPSDASDAQEHADATAGAAAASQSAASGGGGSVRSPGQYLPITKVTTDNLAKLSKANGTNHGTVACAAAGGSLQQRGRAASDPTLLVTAGLPPRLHADRQQSAIGGSRPEPAASAYPAASSFSSMTQPAPPSGRDPAVAAASVQPRDQEPVWHGRNAAAAYGSVNGFVHANLTGHNGVTTSMAAFLAAEELAAKPLVSESQIARTVQEVEFFHGPAGMHPVPSRVAHFRRGSPGRNAGAPTSALSLEEQKLLQSLEVLNERLKITEAASAVASTPSVKGEIGLAPQATTWSTAAAQAGGSHRAALDRYPASRQQRWADET